MLLIEVPVFHAEVGVSVNEYKEGAFNYDKVWNFVKVGDFLTSPCWRELVARAFTPFNPLGPNCDIEWLRQGTRSKYSLSRPGR